MTVKIEVDETVKRYTAGGIGDVGVCRCRKQHGDAVVLKKGKKAETEMNGPDLPRSGGKVKIKKA